MSSPDLGKSISECTHFMLSVLRECQSLLVDIESQLDTEGLTSASGNKVVFEDLSRHIESPDSWMQRRLARILSPAGRGNAAGEAVVLEIHLTSEAADQAMLVVGHVRFDQRVDPYEHYKASEWIGTRLPEDFRFGEPYAFRRGERALPAGVFPDAASLRFVGWPLVAFTDAAAIRSQVTDHVRRWRLEP